MTATRTESGAAVVHWPIEENRAEGVIHRARYEPSWLPREPLRWTCGCGETWLIYTRPDEPGHEDMIGCSIEPVQCPRCRWYARQEEEI